ncbi:MAG: glycosyltransferase [Methylococcaceae bacterium]|jgi:GT2 family glycosyltransferase
MCKYIFIAVNYNGAGFTIDYIQSINNLSLNGNEEIKIIIIDNNSEKNDLKIIEKFTKISINVKLIKLSDNQGYFKGLNKGIKIVEKDKNTSLIIGNNDLTFDKNFILNLKKINYDNNVMVLAPNIITKEGRQQNPHVIDSVSFVEKFKSQLYFSNYYIGQIFRFINQHIKRVYRNPPVSKNNYKQMKIKRGIGACYILTPNFTKKFGKLDDRVFLWGEEALLSNQIESVGGITLYDPSLVVRHHESASVALIQSKARYHIAKKSYKIYKKYL